MLFSATFRVSWLHLHCNWWHRHEAYSVLLRCSCCCCCCFLASSIVSRRKILIWSPFTHTAFRSDNLEIACSCSWSWNWTFLSSVGFFMQWYAKQNKQTKQKKKKQGICLLSSFFFLANDTGTEKFNAKLKTSSKTKNREHVKREIERRKSNDNNGEIFSFHFVCIVRIFCSPNNNLTNRCSLKTHTQTRLHAALNARRRKKIGNSAKKENELKKKPNKHEVNLNLGEFNLQLIILLAKLKGKIVIIKTNSRQTSKSTEMAATAKKKYI